MERLGAGAVRLCLIDDKLLARGLADVEGLKRQRQWADVRVAGARDRALGVALR